MANLRRFSPFGSGILRQALGRVEEAMFDDSIANGVIVPPFVMGSTSQSVNHGLGAVPRGAIVIAASVNQAYTIDAASFTQSTLVIQAPAANASVSLWVF